MPGPHKLNILKATSATTKDEALNATKKQKQKKKHYANNSAKMLDSCAFVYVVYVNAVWGLKSIGAYL